MRQRCIREMAQARSGRWPRGFRFSHQADIQILHGCRSTGTGSDWTNLFRHSSTHALQVRDVFNIRNSRLKINCRWSVAYPWFP